MSTAQTPPTDFIVPFSRNRQELNKKLATGWPTPEAYAEYRRRWDNAWQTPEVPEYPLELFFFLSHACSLSCPMCYRVQGLANGEEKRTTMFDFDLYADILQQAGKHTLSIRFGGTGEATMHPRLPDFIRLAKDSGIPEVSLLTNGARLGLPYMEKLMDAGLDWLCVSVDGYGEVYNGIRKPLTFEGTLKHLQELHAFKQAHGLIKPVVTLQSIWDFVEKDADAFMAAVEPVTDSIAFISLIKYPEVHNPLHFADHYPCPTAFRRLAFYPEGTAVYTCCLPTRELGDARTQSVHEIWHGQELERLRTLLRKPGGYKEDKRCRECVSARKIYKHTHTFQDGRVLEMDVPVWE